VQLFQNPPFCSSTIQSAIFSRLIQIMENSDRWGLDMFRIAELTDNRTLTCVTYTIFQVKNVSGFVKIS
jgi:hypothetical protein